MASSNALSPSCTPPRSSTSSTSSSSSTSSASSSGTPALALASASKPSSAPPTPADWRQRGAVRKTLELRLGALATGLDKGDMLMMHRAESKQRKLDKEPDSHPGDPLENATAAVEELECDDERGELLVLTSSAGDVDLSALLC